MEMNIYRKHKTCCTIWRPFWFAMAAILNPKWLPKYKNPPIWAKFGFQVDYDVANWYPSFGSHIMILQIISHLVIIILFLLSFFRQKFVRHISRRCFAQTLWNHVGISYAMWSCAFKCWFFQNGCRCHGNGQHAKKLKKTQKWS